MATVPRLRADRLKRARTRAKLSRSDLARKIGLLTDDLPQDPRERDNVLSAARIRIRQWEIGAEQPRPRMLQALADALSVPTLWLLEGDQQHPTLAALRLKAGMSLTAMCEATGVAYGTYYRLETGQRVSLPATDVIASIAAALQTTTEDVVAAIRNTRSGMH